MTSPIVTLWDKVKVWFSAEEQTVVMFLSHEEQLLVSLFKPILASAEAALVSELKVFITAVLVTAQGSKTLPDWETAIMNGLKLGGKNLVGIVENMGSNAFQALIGLLLTQISSSNNAAPGSQV